MQKDANKIPLYLLVITATGSYIYGVHTEGGEVAGVVLKCATCLRILLFLHNRSIIPHFCECG